jgi:hypothetical protein
LARFRHSREHKRWPRVLTTNVTKQRAHSRTALMDFDRYQHSGEQNRWARFAEENGNAQRAQTLW